MHIAAQTKNITLFIPGLKNKTIIALVAFKTKEIQHLIQKYSENFITINPQLRGVLSGWKSGSIREPSGPWRLTFDLGQLGNLSFFIQTNNIHEFEGCFLKAQVSSNGFKFSMVALLNLEFYWSVCKKT